MGGAAHHDLVQLDQSGRFPEAWFVEEWDVESTAAGLDGKSVLVTGAAHRVGAEIVRTLHRAGANIVLHYRSSGAPAEAIRDQLEAQRAGSIALLQGDLLDTAALPGLVARATAVWGQLDVLINNASTFYPTPVETATEDQWEDLMGTNLKAPFFLSQAAYPALAARRGCIVNLVDVHADRPMPQHPIYSMAKAGLAMMTKSLARELGPEVRVNGIAPGVVLWPEGGASDDYRREVLERTALGRPGDPRDIARAVRFLIADAEYVTGEIIRVDGGRSLNI
jgi:pteridine reductase